MLFNSFEFVALLVATLVIYYLPCMRRVQVQILIVASFAFYAYGNPSLVFLLMVSIGVNALASYRVMKSPKSSCRKTWAVAGVAANLSILAFFKYGGLLASSLYLAPTRPDSVGYFLINLPLPIGISFFTFQGISLVVDAFREHGKVETSVDPLGWKSHLLNTAFFKSFFPQLVAGPIVKAHDFFPQIGLRCFRRIQWEPSLCALIFGYFLKMVVADNLRDLTYWMAYPYFEAQSSIALLALLWGYSMQIFADFAGYSLIAIGLARLFGYELMQNFNFPYIAQSLSEFWRRWHISLSTWLREYLYIPLGGNRCGRFRTYSNLLVVMVLGGLWHGAAWSYAVWGLYHGLGLALERAFGGGRSAPDQPFRVLKIMGVFAFVTLGWLLFKLPRFEEAVAFVHSLVANWHLPTDLRLLSYVVLYSAPVVLWHTYHLLGSASCLRVMGMLRPLVYAAALTAIFLNSGSPGAFIYFQF